MFEDRLNDELAAVEAALASLTPTRSGVQRDRLMFLAGRASQADGALLRRRRRFTVWLWPCATAASLLVAAVLGVVWAAGGRPEVVERVVYVPAAAGPAASARSSTAFANWKPAPSVGSRSTGAMRQPKTTPDRSVPKSSENGSQPHAIRLIA